MFPSRAPRAGAESGATPGVPVAYTRAVPLLSAGGAAPRDVPAQPRLLLPIRTREHAKRRAGRRRRLSELPQAELCRDPELAPTTRLEARPLPCRPVSGAPGGMQPRPRTAGVERVSLSSFARSRGSAPALATARWELQRIHNNRTQHEVLRDIDKAMCNVHGTIASICYLL